MDFNPLTDRREEDFAKNPTGVIARARFFLATSMAWSVYVEGADISHHQGTIYPTVLYDAGIRFVILKASEHTSFVDTRFAENWPKLLDEGIVVGTYHFNRGNYLGAAQANHHLDVIDPLIQATGGEIIPPYCDVETMDGVAKTTLGNRVHAFNQTIEEDFKKGGNYSSYSLWNSYVGNVSWAKDYHNWVAHWTSADYPALPPGWTEESTPFWQYGISGRYSWVSPAFATGVSGNELDMNRYFGTLAELKEFAGITPTEDDQTLQEQVDGLVSEIAEINARLDALEADSGQGAALEEIQADIAALQATDADLDGRLEILESIKDAVGNIFS